MPKEIIKKERVSLPEVNTIFNKRKKDGELNYLQRIAHEHAQRSAKINTRSARSLHRKLMEEYELSDEIATNIINFVPETVDEMRVFIQDASRVYKTEEVQGMLDLVSEALS